MSIARSSLFFAAGTLISRVSGLIRDVVITHILGAGPLHDAFIVAQRIPNLLRDMLAEGAMGSSFTKVYTGLKVENPEAADRLLFQMLYLALIVMLALTGLGIAAAGRLVGIMSLGTETSSLFDQNAITMTKILFPSLGMSVLGAIAMGALYQKGRFFFNAIIPVLANLGVIAGGLFFGHWLTLFFPNWVAASGDPRVLGLAWGTLLGFFVQMTAALWNVRTGMLRLAKEYWNALPWSPEIGSVLRLMGPAVIATSAAPINSIINTNFATGVGPGAVTWLTYAFRILQLPIGIFGVAVGVYALPALTKAVVKAGRRVDGEVSRQLQQACTFVTWLLLPCMMFALVNHQLIIDFLLRHGHYTPEDVRATGNALFAYAFSMIAYGLIKVLTSFYYATDKTSFAMKVSLLSIAVNLLFNWLLVAPFGHVGLALTSSVTLSINALLLLWGTRKMGVSWRSSPLKKHLLWLTGGATIFLILALGNQIMAHWIDGGLKLGMGWVRERLLAEQWLDATFLNEWQGVWQRIPQTLFLLYSGGLVLAIFGFCGLKAYGISWKRIQSQILRRLGLSSANS